MNEKSAMDGKSFVVTGAGSGIGKACALQLASKGALVTLADVDGPGGASTQEMIAALGRGRAQFVKADVSQESDVRHMVEFAEREFGALAGAINAAGVGQRGVRLHALSGDEWDRCVNVNLRGMFLCMKHEVASMLKGGGGAVVAVSSAAAVMGLVNSAEYCAAKAGVTGLVRSAAIDYVRAGIRVNAILPGATDTPLAHLSSAENPELAASLSLPIARMASPDEIANAAVFLVSEEASYITGACLAVDGGLTVA